MFLILVACAVIQLSNAADCPASGDLPPSHPKLLLNRRARSGGAVAELDVSAVKADLVSLMTNSQDFWPADYGHYGPFFIRLAWHASGSYRISDGRGGSDGGHIRFEPEQSWADNTNLDKARRLLFSIKVKYGKALSWADLIVLSGTVAIESMGGPSLGFCAGRIDDIDGSESILLGPNVEQEALAPCPVEGDCDSPLGATTVGLIYVNPEGPKGNPEPSLSFPQIRDTFGRMGMNDSETVALIGGGHALGKMHGACPLGAGPSPAEQPENPYPGNCGTGKGKDSATSGFEGAWTTQPTTWTNDYYTNLKFFTWNKSKGDGDHWQWFVNEDSPQAPQAHGAGTQPITMLTADVALLKDPTYKQLVDTYASDMAAFNHAFSHAWYKLTTRDMGPATRCIGSLVPPAQPWQFPLPSPPTNLADFDKVRTAIEAVMAPSTVDFTVFARLAYRCAATFRMTDKRGGCNGARIRFSPEKDYAVNAGLDGALSQLQPVKTTFGTSLSWSDLIVLAGNVAIEKAGGNRMDFCGGRTDAVDGAGSIGLEPRVSGAYTDKVALIKDSFTVMGLSDEEAVAIMGLNSLGNIGMGFAGMRSIDPNTLSSNYFKLILETAWTTTGVGATQHFVAPDSSTHMLKTDLTLKYDAIYAGFAGDYAVDNARFLKDFAQVWTSLMNADRFDGPTANVCDKPAATPTTPTTLTSATTMVVTNEQLQDTNANDNSGVVAFLSVFCVLLVIGVVGAVLFIMKLRKQISAKYVSPTINVNMEEPSISSSTDSTLATDNANSTC
eukprot:m.54090 g.54090  ORF g.54090 m.54090 type:complete len:782 (-) comp21864_c0_seq1:160-2505(-)